jgi:Leucine-rich repeat (LRR) protein
MASAGVLPWLVGLPANDTTWDAAPLPTTDTRNAVSVSASPKSEPGTLRSRLSDAMDGTVNIRAQSNSPAKKQSLAWKKRLINGDMSYGDQTDLFGPSALENIFTRNQASDSGSQKKPSHMGLKHRLSMDHRAENTNPATANQRHGFEMFMPSSPPTPPAHASNEKRMEENSPDRSPASRQSQSSVADMLSDMMGKIDELSDSNKSYQSRMQALKDRLGDSEEWQPKVGSAESNDKHARISAKSPRGQARRGSPEFLDSKRKSFEQAEQSTIPGESADWTQSEHDQPLEGGDTSEVVHRHMRQSSDDRRHKHDDEDVRSAPGSSRSAIPQPAGFDTEAESPKSEIITRQPRESTVHVNGNDETSCGDDQVNSDLNDTEAGAGRNTDSRQHNAHLAPGSRNITGNLSATDSELEDLTPVFLEKRTTSTGGVHFNAVRTDHATRADIYKQRREIDKTETSQRAREAELAMDAEDSEITDREHSTPNRARVNEHMGSPEQSVVGPDDSDLLEARHVSGFTDAPEVEEDMPIRTKQAEFSTDWDFSEPPQNESSELIAAHKRSESEHKWSVSFGARQLDDYSFRVPDRELEDRTEDTVDANDGAQPSELNESYSKSPSLRSSSPSSDVPAPGSRMPFEFRRDSIPAVETTTAKARRITSRGSVLGSVRAANLTLPKTRSSPVQASADPDKYDVVLTNPRSPPQVYIEDTDGALEYSSFIEGKRPLPRSPLVSPTPKRRRTLHNSELQSMSDANVSYHSQLQEVLTGGKRKEARQSEKRNAAPPEVIAQRKIARPRNSTPTQGPATKDYINEAKKVIELLRGNINESILLGGITEAEEDDNTYEDYEEEGGEEEGAGDEDGDDEARYGTYNTHKSDNMRTLAPQQVAHLIGGEVHGMTFDRSKNCWIRSKSFEHKQFLDPRDALSSDDDPFREISDLTVERPIRVHVTHPSQELEATTIVHHDMLDGTGLSYDDTGVESDREDSPQRTQKHGHENPRLPGEETTLAHYNDEQENDDSDVTPTMDSSMQTPLPKQSTAVPAEVARLQVATKNPNANINNTFLLSDLPDFTVNEEDHERPSERALATRLASYAAVEAGDPYTVATTELVKAITDVQGREIYWSDLTSLCLHNKSLKSLHNLGEHCARIEKLDVSSNALTQLDGVPMFVRELNARSNQLVSLTSWTHLMHLQYLDISSNGLESLDGLGHLIHLRELRVDNNRIRRLDGIADLDGLITLSARKNSIRELDFEHFRFGRVVEMDVSDNQITSIQGLEGLSSLRTLKLDNNQLGDSLVVTSPMPRLRHLSLRSCALETLDVTNFPNLRTLEVDNNRLSNIIGLSTLKKLDLLSMCGQNLPETQRIEILQAPIEAQTIRLSRNTIPDLQITQPFMTVKHLSLSDTGLSSIPANFGLDFPNLRSLDISYNGLKDIRPLAPLGALETLNLTGCRVERLRKTVATLGKLQKLRKLDLKHNPLTQGFYGPRCEVSSSDSSSSVNAIAEEDRIYRSKLDEDTAMRRRTYELLLAYSCCPKDGFELDGLVFNRKAAIAKDEVWERLVELGVLRRV